MGFRIKQYAYEQGMSLGDVARRLRMPLSNLSAVASGRRSVSLGLLNRIAAVLNCAVSELFEEKRNPGVYRGSELSDRILQIERENYMGRDKGWTHRLMMAQRSHYGRACLKGG